MKKINLILSRLALVLAMAFMVACGGDPIKEDPTPTPDPTPDPKPDPDPTPELVVELAAELISAGSSSAEIKLTTKNLKEYAYVVGEKDADISADIIFATGTAVTCVDGENIVTIENLEPAKNYVVTFAGATIEDEFADKYAKVNVTTEAFVDELTIYNVDYSSFSAHFNFPTEKVQPGNVVKWGLTELPKYNENRFGLFSDAEMLNLHENWHNYVTESKTFNFSEKNSYVGEPAEDNALYSPIVPGQPMYLMFGEYAYSSEQEDHWGWGAGYYNPLFDMNNFIADYYATGKFPTDDSKYWTGYYRKEFVMSKEPDKMSGKPEVKMNLTPMGGKITITPPAGSTGVCFAIFDSSTFVGELLPLLSNKKDYMQWFVTSYYAFATGLALTIMEETTIQLEDLYFMYQGKTYTLFMTTLGDEFGSRQSYKTVDFKLPAPTKPAPTAAVKGIDDPDGTPQHDLVWFNLKCTSGNAIAAKYIANYEREWASMVSAFKKNYNITEEEAVQAMLDQYGAALTAEEVAQINTAEGWNINFTSRADATTICGLAVMNDEGTWGYALDQKRTIKEPYATPVNSPLFDELQGEWTATTTIQNTHYHYCKDPNHRDNHDCAHPGNDDGNNYLLTTEYTVSSKVTIGNVGYETTLPEEVYQLFFNSSNLKTKEQVDAVYAQFTAAVDDFNANVRGQNRILCQGFDLEYDADKITCKYPECSDKPDGIFSAAYAHPYELFIADETKYSAYNYESPIYDFGPKWYLEIAADGTVTAPFNVNYFAPMAQWYKNVYQFMGASANATLPFVRNAEGEILTGHFPVTVSADKNTITINPLSYTYSTTDENGVTITRTEDFYPQIVRDGSNSSTVSYSLYSRIIAPIVLTRNGAVPPANSVVAPAAAKVDFKPVYEVNSVRQAPCSRTALPLTEMKAPAVVKYKVMDAEEFRAASKAFATSNLPRK